MNVSASLDEELIYCSIEPLRSWKWDVICTQGQCWLTGMNSVQGITCECSLPSPLLPAGSPLLLPPFSSPCPHRIRQPRYNLLIPTEPLRTPVPAVFERERKKKKKRQLFSNLQNLERGREGTWGVEKPGRIIGQFPASSMAALKQLRGLSSTLITARSGRLTGCSAGN